MSLKEELRKAVRKGFRDALSPGLAYGLEKMYGHLDLGSRTWGDEAQQLLDHMRDHAKAQRGKK